jgi:cytosolic phospholipase A2
MAGCQIISLFIPFSVVMWISSSQLIPAQISKRHHGSNVQMVPLPLPTNKGYAKQKGILGWPIGIGWPKDTSPSENVATLTDATSSSPTETEDKLALAKSFPSPDYPTDPITQKYGLGHCNIWIGTTTTRTTPEEPPKPKSVPVTVDDGWRLDPEDGIMLIYLPLLPNLKVPDVVPETTEFLSTWNFQYTPAQVDELVALAGANFGVGEERIRRAVRAMWLRKKGLREEREREGRILVKGKALLGVGVDSLRGFGRDVIGNDKDSI